MIHLMQSDHLDELMLGVPVLVGSCAYAVAEGAAWPGSMADKSRSARKFYAVMAVAMAVGLMMNYLGFHAVKMLFLSAVINGLLAPPLIMQFSLVTASRSWLGACTKSTKINWGGLCKFRRPVPTEDRS
jgi:Mn2+/Fe2+ NRAMP family transporter